MRLPRRKLVEGHAAKETGDALMGIGDEKLEWRSQFSTLMSGIIVVSR
jgi:hypothetical protein